MTSRRARLQPYDRLLKKFRYRAALDAAIATGRPPAVAALIDELAQRGVLASGLEGRTAEQLVPLIRFLLRNVTNPRYAEQLVQVAEQVQ
jgi:U3 small nucleolar RNA-associated protein 15